MCEKNQETKVETAEELAEKAKKDAENMEKLQQDFLAKKKLETESSKEAQSKSETTQEDVEEDHSNYMEQIKSRVEDKIIPKKVDKKEEITEGLEFDSLSNGVKSAIISNLEYSELTPKIKEQISEADYKKFLFEERQRKQIKISQDFVEQIRKSGN